MRVDQIVAPASEVELPALELNYSDSTKILTLKRADLPAVEVNIANLLASPGARDCSVFSLFTRGVLVNVLAATYPSKQNPPDYLEQLRMAYNDENPVYILIPNAEDISTVFLRFVAQEGRNILFTGDLQASVVENHRFIDDFPTIQFSQPVLVGSTLSVPVIASAAVDMFFESDLGVVLTPYIRGSGNVLVNLANIPPSTVGLLKANFKYWSNVANIQLTT